MKQRDIVHEQITLIRPDDWHIHLRDSDSLATTVAHAAAQFGRVIVMPNLNPPVLDVKDALAYRQRILNRLPSGSHMQPLMTLYLSEHTTAAQIAEAAANEHVYACKLYPAHATTGAEHGVADVTRIYPVLEAMEKHHMPLLVHGEDPGAHVDIFDREKVFIDGVLSALVRDFPGLKIVLEHITTEEAVQFVEQGPANLAATITAHHLMIDRGHMFAGGIRPHLYCLPVAKRRHHRDALRAAVCRGSAKFFLGTDSAPHPRHRKESACGCAGIYTAFTAIELYAQVFEQLDALDKLEGFASRHGPAFYGLPVNSDRIRLTKTKTQIPASFELGDDRLIPFMAGESLAWRHEKV